MQRWRPETSRKIIERHVVELELQLVSPAHLGNGEEEDLTDMPLMTDLYDPTCPVLLGTNLAGGLRAALRRWELGHFVKSTPVGPNNGVRQLSHALFGDAVDPTNADSPDQLQSPLIVDDALGTTNARTEIRDGVRLDPKTRTADDQGLFNGEYWQAGTTFPIRLELVICEDDDQHQLKEGFAVILESLKLADSQQTISLGGRKRRGFGVVKADGWKYASFDYRTRKGLESWLQQAEPQSMTLDQIKDAMQVEALPKRVGREFTVLGSFLIDGSLLIRSGSLKDDLNIDMVHLHSARIGNEGGLNEVPILSGTSLAGALRTRCWAITELIGGSSQIATEFVEQLFGPMLDHKNNEDRAKQPHASRVVIQDGIITGTPSIDERLVQSRVSIDRFTGGALDTALFNQQPVFGPSSNNQSVEATLKFTIHAPSDAQIGLLLLALKDLATADLPIGGEVSVGRGLLRLKNGLKISDRRDQTTTRYQVGPNGETQSSEHRIGLNRFVTAFHDELNPEGRNNLGPEGGEK